jgi:Transcriptional regulator, AbiEi antitoxin
VAKKRRQSDQDSAHLQALTGRQWGYVTREQLLALGLTASAIRHLLTTGRLIPVHAGVYAVGHLPVGPVARAFAAVLACGPGALLSHGSAATLWGFNKYWDTPLEVTVETSHRRRPGLTVHRSRTLTAGDRDCQLGVPATSPARTALDIAPGLTDHRLTRVVNDGQHARVLHLDDLAHVLDRNPTHPGMKRLRPFVEAPSGPTRSELEDHFLAFCTRYGLPTPITNLTINGHEVDALFPAERVIVEIDSWEFHRFRSSFEGDRDRDTDQLAGGYVTIRLTDERMKHTPEHEAERLHKILRERRRTLTVLSNTDARVRATGARTTPERPAS